MADDVEELETILRDYAGNDWPAGVPSHTVVVEKHHMSQAADSLSSLRAALARAEALQRDLLEKVHEAQIHHPAQLGEFADEIEALLLSRDREGSGE